MYVRIPAALAAIIAASTLAACGSDSTTQPATTAARATKVVPVKATPVAEPAPVAEPEPEPSSAYDDYVLEGSEKEIRKQMRKVIRDTGGTPEDATAHCIADSDRNYTCESSIVLHRSDLGLCARMETTQRGNVDPETGDYSWKNTDVDDSGAEYDC